MIIILHLLGFHPPFATLSSKILELGGYMHIEKKFMERCLERWEQGKVQGEVGP